MQVVLPGTPQGPGSPPPLGAVQVVGYAALPGGDPGSYLSPRAGMAAAAGSAPVSPLPARAWTGTQVRTPRNEVDVHIWRMIFVPWRLGMAFVWTICL